MNNELVEIDESKFALTDVPTLQVTNQISYERVVAFRVKAKEREKLINETFDPIVEKNRSAWKQALATRDKFLNPVLEVITAIDTNIKAFKREQERITLEAQKKLRRETEEKARKEKEELEKRAEKWADKGNTEKAEELKEQAQQVEALTPTVAPMFTKMAGDNTRKTWKAEIVNFSILPEQYKLPNFTMLNAIARTDKGKMLIPGIKWICE